MDVTTISTPFDRVPLYIMLLGEDPMTLLNSSHTASKSTRFNFGTPATMKNITSFSLYMNYDLVENPFQKLLKLSALRNLHIIKKIPLNLYKV